MYIVPRLQESGTGHMILPPVTHTMAGNILVTELPQCFFMLTSLRKRQINAKWLVYNNLQRIWCNSFYVSNNLDFRRNSNASETAEDLLYEL